MWLWRPRKQQQILDEIGEAVDARDDFLRDRGVAAVSRQPAADHLDGTTDARQWISDFVGNERRHLAKPRHCRLLTDLLFHLYARAEVVQDASELTLTTDGHLANRQVDGKRAAVAAKRGHLTPDPD